MFDLQLKKNDIGLVGGHRKCYSRQRSQVNVLINPILTSLFLKNTKNSNLTRLTVLYPYARS